jgi:Holliday junction resolvase RusA-like endonuclease
MTGPGSSYRFEVPGPLYAYRRLRDRGGYRNYDRFKKRVLLLAMENGFRRFDTTAALPVTLNLTVHWKKGPRIDLSNVVKGIEDALFSQDRWVREIHAFSSEKSGPERAEVEILL